MSRLDQLVYRYNTVLIVLAAISYNLSIEYLSEKGYSAPSLLVYRGVLGSSLVAVMAWHQGVSLVPQKPRAQVIRFFNAGIALLLAFESFHRINGVTVSTIQRLEIPFAVILGVGLGHQVRDSKFTLSLLTVGLVLSSLLLADKIGEDPIGLLMVIVAVAMTAVAYLLGKKSVILENNLTVLNVTNLGGLAIGGLVCILQGKFSFFHLADLWLIGTMTLSQFILNYIMTVLFRHYDVARAQRPYLLSSVCILALEMVTGHRKFVPLHIAFVLLVVGMVYIITLHRPLRLISPAQIKDPSIS